MAAVTRKRGWYGVTGKPLENRTQTRVSPLKTLLPPVTTQVPNFWAHGYLLVVGYFLVVGMKQPQ